MSTRRTPPRRHLPTSPFTRPEVVPPTTEGFRVGDRVTVDSVGMGTVVEVTDDYVRVDFGTSGVRLVPPGAPGLAVL